MMFLALPPRTVATIPDYRPCTPDTARKARQRARRAEIYREDPERLLAGKRVANLAAHQIERARFLSRRKYREHRKQYLASQAKRDAQRTAALRILRAVLAILDGQPIRMYRPRRSKYARRVSP